MCVLCGRSPTNKVNQISKELFIKSWKYTISERFLTPWARCALWVHIAHRWWWPACGTLEPILAHRNDVHIKLVINIRSFYWIYVTNNKFIFFSVSPFSSTTCFLRAIALRVDKGSREWAEPHWSSANQINILYMNIVCHYCAVCILHKGCILYMRCVC